MEAKDVKGLVEAYGEVNRNTELLYAEIVVVKDILGEDVEILDEAPNVNVNLEPYKKSREGKGGLVDLGPYERTQATKQQTQTTKQETQQQIDRNTRDRQTMNPVDYFGTGTKPESKPTPKPESKPSGGLTPKQKAEVLAKQRAETDAAMKGDPRAPRPTGSTPRPAAPVPKPNPTVLAKKGGVEGKLDKSTGKFNAGNFSASEKARYNKVSTANKDAATNKTYQQLRKTDPAKAKEFGMKANQAKYGKDFAKPKTPNPLMKDMPGQNKAELETIRGNAAINSIAKSPNAKKILNTSKIGQASLNRSEFGSATKPQPPKPTIMKNSLDIFDIIKGHLLDEGYADTEESAMVIMTNMSEEWRDEIVERYKGKHGQSSDEYKRDRSPGGKMVSGDDEQSGAEYTHGRRVKAENPGSQPDEGGKTKPKSQGRMDRGTRADLEYRKANLKKKEAEKKETNEELEYVDENRRAARSAGASKDDRKKQTDPSKDGFTGIGNMSIDQIRKMSARIEKEKTKKEETEYSGNKITIEQIIALNNKYGKVQEGMGLVTGTAKAVNQVLKPAGQTAEQGKKAVGNLTKAMDTVAKPVKSAAKAVLGVSPEKNAAMMQKRRPQ